ncbi:nucleotide exchange factor GrpE [Fructilactobacillus fructivorans]|uniref:nucleotide exchange factor GrpE n=1 Tax=Fructilactobacillus fructivorans TaxID=1614 RepID=UPI0007051DAD|nr:nucleotide exchange factor GrpE [Fructilactobacillus fructivorans]KRN39660.1 heat shock protein GrpE [Fructilactobacillus fructivorans]KRN43381.1 heat shock protein GrpE [Fructilactobacillus fructivorans]
MASDKEKQNKDIKDESKNVDESSKPKKKDVETDEKDDSAKKIDELKQKLDSVQDKYLRAEAEIQNIQNRNKKERADIVKYGAQDFAKDVVPIMDDLKRALDVDVSDENGKQLKKGIEMVQQHLEKALKDNDISEINADGVEFDPSQHQAVQTVSPSDEHPKGTVVSVLQSGYKIADRVLRPAMVVVAQ